MTPKAEAVARAKEVLNNERLKLIRSLNDNRYQINKLAKDSATIKKEINVLDNLLRSLDGRKSNVSQS